MQSVTSLLTALAPFTLLHTGSPAHLVACAAALTFVAGARSHVSNFWVGKLKVPGVSQYNTAIRNSEQLVQALGLLGFGWIVIGFLGLLLH